MFGGTQQSAFQSKPFTSFQPVQSTANTFQQPKSFGTTFQTSQPVSGTGQQQSIQQLVQDTQLLVKSIAGPEIFNDDRNEVISKLNKLLAAFGVGQGYYKEGQQPVNYTEKNAFYRFKGVVYNRMCRNTDEDGIVCLLLSVSVDQVNTDERKLKVVEQIDLIFGQNSGVKSTIHSIKAMDLQVTEVIITAYEQGRGRVPALTLFKFLNQADKMNALRSNLQCIKLFPLVAFSKIDREKYLNTPPEGFDPNLWKQGVRSNPDPERFIPQPIYGFEKLSERKRMQEVTTAVQSTILSEQMERLKKLTSDISNIKAHLRNNKHRGRELFNRFLRLSIYIAQELRKGYALNKLEDSILAKAESASSELIGPNGLKDRINGILKYVETDRQQLTEYFRGIKPDLVPEEQKLLKEQLQTAQTQLEQIKEVVAYTSKALEVMDSRKNQTAEKHTN